MLVQKFVDLIQNFCSTFNIFWRWSNIFDHYSNLYGKISLLTLVETNLTTFKKKQNMVKILWLLSKHFRTSRWIRQKNVLRTNFLLQTIIIFYSDKAIAKEVDLSNNEKYDMQKLLWLMAISYKGYAKSCCLVLLQIQNYLGTVKTIFWSVQIVLNLSKIEVQK